MLVRVMGWYCSHEGLKLILVFPLFVAVTLLVCVTRIAKASLDKALAENARLDSVLVPSMPPTVADAASDLPNPLIIKVESSLH